MFYWAAENQPWLQQQAVGAPERHQTRKRAFDLAELAYIRRFCFASVLYLFFFPTNK